MLIVLASLAAAMQAPVDAADCVYLAIPAEQRSRIGEAILARRAKAAADNAALSRAVDDCARQYSLSAERAQHTSGYSAMRMTAELIASQVRRPEWAQIAHTAVRQRPARQRQALAETNSGGAEFELVLARMIGEDASIATTLQSADRNVIERFVLMVKLFAVAENERDLAARP